MTCRNARGLGSDCRPLARRSLESTRGDPCHDSSSPSCASSVLRVQNIAPTTPTPGFVYPPPLVPPGGRRTTPDKMIVYPQARHEQHLRDEPYDQTHAERRGEADTERCQVVGKTIAERQDVVERVHRRNGNPRADGHDAHCTTVIS